MKFAPDGPTSTGPPRGIMQTLSGVPWGPVELKLWAADQKATYVDEEAAPAGGRGAGAARGADPAGRGGDAAAGRGGRGRGDEPPVAIIGSQVISGGRGGGGGGGGGGRGGAQQPADIRVSWHKHRGPGDITYDTDEIRLQNNGDPKLFSRRRPTPISASPANTWSAARSTTSLGQRRRRRSVLLDDVFVR